MRRARISVKPNFRAGSRAGTESEQVSQGASEVEEVGPPASSQQQNVALTENSEDVGIKDAPEIPSLMNQNAGAPSTGAATLSAVPHRRMRISATPKLVRPKLTSTSRTGPSAKTSALASSPMPNEEHVQIHDLASDGQASISIISNDFLESGTSRKSTSPTQLPAQSSMSTQSSPPCVPSTSGLRKSPVREKGSVADCPPSPQLGQVPQQPPQEPESPECLPSSALSSVCIQPSHCEKTSSSDMTEKYSDKDRILRELKLKELMKIERRKDIQMMKRRAGHKEYTALDRSNMTMRDLIYYLPNTSPMRLSVVCDENQAETVIPPSPKLQITAEEDEDEEDEENEEMLVPKVRVAEDGSIILDEESLTVRVQRTSNTKVVESSAALFERGFTTTYSSFRKLNHVKSWSVRETDLFFLAISMVGTDFSLIGQLLTHRSRSAIRNKFKKEERLNPWRVDKAFRNKRPYDKEFFSYLLEKVLAKDKDKRKSVKLILPKTRKARKSKDDHEESEDDGDISVEKENEDVSNVNKANTSVPDKKRRKRTRDASKDKDNDSSTEGQVKRKRQRKCSRKRREAHTIDDAEGENDISVESDALNLNKEDELERSSSASKRRHKRSKSDGQEQNEKPVKRTKGKQVKESVIDHEESSIMAEDGSVTKKKRKRAKNIDLNGDEPGKKNTKKQKAQKKSAIEEEEAAEQREASAAFQEAEKLSAPGDTAEVTDNVPPKTSRRSKKPLPNLATTRSRKCSKPEAVVDAERESHDESIQTGASSTSEGNGLRMRAVVVLEKTPPRLQHLLSPSKLKSENKESVPSLSSPASPSSIESSQTKQARMQRAGKVRCNLYTSSKTGMTDKDEAEPESAMVLLERITHETEHEDEDISLNENLLDLSCLRDFNSQSFQRRPMVVLSREEVDVVLDTSDQCADDDLSVSPLDLSMNTERSFPLECSKIMEDIGKEAEGDRALDEHEERTHETASREERIYEELELGESTLAQLDISNLRDISSSFNPEVCSQSEVSQSQVTTSYVMEEAEPQFHPVACNVETTVSPEHEGSSPLGNVGPVCVKPDAPVTQETVCIETCTPGTSLVVSDVMEESEKTNLPNLLQEPELASSEPTAQSNLTPGTGSRLRSERSLLATSNVTQGLQTPLECPAQIFETLQGSSESKDTQVSVVASAEMKVKEDSQEEVSVQSRPTRRSRFLKPKPNLSQKSRVSVLQNQRKELKTPSALKPKTTEPTISKKPLPSPETDQHVASEDFMDQMETESAKDLSDASTEVQDHDNIIPASVDEVVSKCSTSRCDADIMPPCTALPLPQPLQIGKDTDTGTGHVIVPSEDVCTPTEIIHLKEDGQNDEEPTFILTLYEIPVTQGYLPSSSNYSVMTSDLPMVKSQSVLGFSDHPCTLPSTSVPPRVDPAPIESCGTEKDSCAFKEQFSAHTTWHKITSPHMDDEERDTSANMEMGIPSLNPNSECKKGSKFSPFDGLAPKFQSTPSVSKCKFESKETSLASVTKDLAENVKDQMMVHMSTSKPILLDIKDEESDVPGNLESGKRSEFAPLEYLAPRTQSTPIRFNIGKGITSLPRDSEDTEQSESVSNKVLADVFVPLSEEKKDDSSKDRTLDTECKYESKEASLASFTLDLLENSKEQPTSDEPIMLYRKDEESDACKGLDTRTPDLQCKQDLGSRFSVSKCVEQLPQNPEDTEQCERVSHVVLGDVFVPVSDEKGDDSCKERTHTESKLENKEASLASLPERQDAPYEELTKGEKSPVVSSQLLHCNATEESNDTPLLSKEKKAPTRRRARQLKPQPKLVIRDHAIDDSKTDRLIKKTSQPTSSHLILPAFHEEKLAGISNVPDELLVDKMSSMRGNKTFVSRGKKVKPKSIAKESPTTSQYGLESKSMCTALHLSQERTHEEENRENIIGDGTTKGHMKSSAEDKELDNAGNVQPCSTDIFSVTTAGSDSETMDSEEIEAETKDVSHMVLPDVFVLVSDDTEDDPSTNWTEPVESIPQRESLTKTSPAHFEEEIKTERVSQMLNEEPTRSPLEDIKTPVRKKGKQEMTRTCTESDSRKTRPSLLTSPKATPSSSSSQLSSPPQDENMVQFEKKLQRRHHIVPCTVRLRSLDPVAQRLNAAQCGDGKSKDEPTVISSPTCRASVTTPSEESMTSLSTEIKLNDPVLENKSPTRRKGKRNESSTRAKPGSLKSVHSISQTRQLSITDWAKKKSHQTAMNQEEKETVKSSLTQPYIKAKEVSQLMVEKARPKLQHNDSEEPESSCLVPVLKETEEVSRASDEVKMALEVAKESTEEPSVSQMKTSPARRRGNATVGNTSTADELQSSQAFVEADSKSTEIYSITSGHQSPKLQSNWPRVVLPRVKLPRTKEAGVCSDSSTPTSSPSRVSESASPPVTPPQLKKSPAQSCSPTADESPDDPSRVSQYFLCDIFTEVEETE